MNMKRKTLLTVMKSLTKAEIIKMLSHEASSAQKNAGIVYLYEKYAAKIKALVYNNTGNEFDGEDIVQETMVEVSKNIAGGRYDEQGKMDSYIMVIAERMWLKEIRKEKIRKSYEQEVAQNTLWYEAKTNQTPERQLIIKEEEQNPFGAFKQLPPNYQKILKLYAEKYSMEEIAQIMSLPSTDAAKALKSRAKNAFIELLKRKSL